MNDTSEPLSIVTNFTTANATASINGTLNSTANGTDMTDVFARYNTITELLNAFAPTSVWAERVVPPIWYMVGLLLNLPCAIIWFGRRMRRNNSSAVYLGTLAVSDEVFLLLHLLHMLHAAYGYDVYNTHGGCETFMFFFYVPQYMSVLLVAAFTAERYVAVCHPFLKEKLCTVKRAWIISGICLAVSVALAAVQIYIWTFYPSLGICNTRPSAAEGSDRSFWNIWSWVVEVIIFMAVPLAVLVFNVLVLREIIRLSNRDVITSTRHHHHQQQLKGGGGEGGEKSSNSASTLTLLSVSFFFVITQLTATVVTNLQLAFPMGQRYLTDSQIIEDPAWYRFFTYLDIRKVLETLCLSHFACYFFVYFLTGKHFRRETAYLLSCHGKLNCPCASSFRGRERYSMVSSNGQSYATGTTCATALTTSM